MTILVVYNPTSHLPRDEIEQLFRSYAGKDRFCLIETSPDKSVAELLRHHLDTASMVVAVGGDGTVSATAAGMLERAIPLGIVPAGSTNMLARVNRVPLQPEAAVRLILGQHELERIDAGVCGDRVLLHLGGAGLDARMFERSSTLLKRRLRWLGYGPAVLRSLNERASNVEVVVDGIALTVRSRLVLIANSGALINPRFTVLPTESRSDGLFEVGIFTADSVTEIAQSVAHLTVMRWREDPRVILLKGRKIRIDALPALPFEFDGDVIGETPFALEVRQRAISMICGNSSESD